MKLYILVPLIGAAFLAVCIGVVFFVGQKEPVVEDVALVADAAATTTEPAPETVVFTEEGRHPSVAANALASAPECDRGVADRTADEERMKMGEISDYTKESVIQAILRRNALFKTASASCVRTYFRIGMLHDDKDRKELETMSDERLEALARFMAVISMEDGETEAAFRTRMLGNEAEWMYEGPEMKVGFEERMENGSVTTYQTASFVNGYWY
ncbi:MAG: hypothetical protein V4682_04130 [Patescibacteria group bacterium]